jgi:hypothetical protein
LKLYMEQFDNKQTWVDRIIKSILE